MELRGFTRKLEILVVEDNPFDIECLEMALKDMGANYHLSIAQDGPQAVDHLTGRGPNSPPRPDLIFLDMHLPKFGGLEVLRQVPDSADLPICVLTSSPSELPAVRAHFRRPIGYLLKPLSAAKLIDCACQLRLN
jgi:CheY-like chemotaxis protein